MPQPVFYTPARTTDNHSRKPCLLSSIKLIRARN
jgi:hypothetical protein